MKGEKKGGALCTLFRVSRHLTSTVVYFNFHGSRVVQRWESPVPFFMRWNQYYRGTEVIKLSSTK